MWSFLPKKIETRAKERKDRQTLVWYVYLICYHTEKTSYRKPIFPQLNRLKERKLEVILALLYLKSQPQSISQGEITLLLTSREYFGQYCKHLSQITLGWGGSGLPHPSLRTKNASRLGQRSHGEQTCSQLKTMACGPICVDLCNAQLPFPRIA